MGRNRSRICAAVRVRPLRIGRRPRRRREDRRGGRGRLFDGAGVMVLMSRQGCSTGEGFLAIGIRTFVRSLAGMDATMSRQRARVAERLFPPRPVSTRPNRLVLCTVTYLATALTHVRFLAGVDSGVHRQCRPLDELLLATRIITHVGSYTTMNAFCPALMSQNSYRQDGHAHHDVLGHFAERILCYMLYRQMP